MSKEGKLERIRSITIEALQERRRNPKGRAWPFIDRIVGVLGIGEADVVAADLADMGREAKQDALIESVKADFLGRSIRREG